MQGLLQNRAVAAGYFSGVERHLAAAALFSSVAKLFCHSTFSFFIFSVLTYVFPCVNIFSQFRVLRKYCVGRISHFHNLISMLRMKREADREQQSCSCVRSGLCLFAKQTMDYTAQIHRMKKLFHSYSAGNFVSDKSVSSKKNDMPGKDEKTGKDGLI